MLSKSLSRKRKINPYGKIALLVDAPEGNVKENPIPIDSDDEPFETTLERIPSPKKVSKVFSQACHGYTRYWGATDQEVTDATQCGSGDKDRVVYCQPTKSRVKKFGPQGITVIIRFAGVHFEVYCYDFDNKIKAFVGVQGGCQSRFESQAVESPDFGTFVDLSPELCEQNESECGARAALYASWFSTKRTPDRRHLGELDVSQFHEFLSQVKAQMTAWRAARREREKATPVREKNSPPGKQTRQHLRASRRPSLESGSLDRTQ